MPNATLELPYVCTFRIDQLTIVYAIRILPSRLARRGSAFGAMQAPVLPLAFRRAIKGLKVTFTVRVRVRVRVRVLRGAMEGLEAAGTLILRVRGTAIGASRP